MKKSDVRLGGVYQVKVSGKLRRVRIDAEDTLLGGWRATNLDTGRNLHVRTAGRLRKPVSIAPPTNAADLWRQWQALKESNPGTALVFRVGNMFECYGTDAAMCGEVLGLAVTERTDTVGPTQFTASMAGFPHADLERNIRELVLAGFRVAVCERVQPGEAKGKPVEKIVT